jgi:GT2 family glycosyltransferase
MEKNSIFIVIPVFNRIKFTRNCLESLYNQTWKNFKVIVIDDGSNDGTSRMIETQFPEVILIKGDGNLWWTKATNLGVAYALDDNADFILTLNNDTILHKEFLEKMIIWALQKPNALLGALAVDVHSNRVVYGGEKINWKLATYEKIIDKIPISSRNGVHEVSHFPGRGLLIPSIVFKNIGLFDEIRFPHYAADFDFTHRAARKGFPIFINYDAKLFVYPEESGSVQLRKSRSIRNYVNHLFGIRGGGNLINFVNFAKMNCPKKYLISFLLLGTLRRIFGYWINNE